MAKSKDALTYGFVGVVILAVAMVVFYKYKEKTRVNEAEVDLSEPADVVGIKESNPYIGTYSPTMPIEGMNHRFSFFTVNKKEEGGYLGSAKMEPIGGGGSSAYFECNDVKASPGELFLRCVNNELGFLSFSGNWVESKDGVPTANGKFLWVKDGSPIVDQNISIFQNESH